MKNLLKTLKVVLLAAAVVFAFTACSDGGGSSKDKDKTKTFKVGSADEWYKALETIRLGGNNKSYIINIAADFCIEGSKSRDNSFGYGVTGIEVTITGDKIISLTEDSTGALLDITKNQTVILRDVDLKGHSKNNMSLVNIVYDSALTMQGNASVYGNTSRDSGGVICHGTFTMQDNASVYGNTSSGVSLGGGVRAGTFTMQDNASVYGNTASGDGSSGGGVSAGTFTIQDNASVYGNTATDYAGGVSAGTFIMQGGTIYGSNASGKDANGKPLANTASNYAAFYGNDAMYGNGTILTSTNDTITGISGDNILLSGSGTASDPWLISNAVGWNIARTRIIGTGGNYHINITNNFQISGGGLTFGSTSEGSTLAVTITGNKIISLSASSTGYLLSVGDRQTIVLQDIDLEGHGDNNSSLVGVLGGSLTMKGSASVYGNTARMGGGVYVFSGVFTMQDNTSVYGNRAALYGGGVYVNSSGNFTKTENSTITGWVGDTATGNVVKDGSDTVLSNRGHAVYAERNGIVKRRESTAGPGVNLIFNGSTGTYSVDGWED